MVHVFLFEGYLLAAPAALMARDAVIVAERRGLSKQTGKLRRVHVLEKATTCMIEHVVANAAVVAEDSRMVKGMPTNKISTAGVEGSTRRLW
ncbi:hypothetical protein [Nonomuraea turcica]|uniref:hypothetical protein n=1 Tax=Nonomuraea sp. G32 TaxID=3067274 RepID=UPI00273C5ACD|nr:hypothetical protein [Nonomuraea sp. G32]MDP4510649.1 hypothetical protein [Nonomuraea sp. G32]